MYISQYMWRKTAKFDKVIATISSTEIRIICQLDEKTDIIHINNEKARLIYTKILINQN